MKRVKVWLLSLIAVIMLASAVPMAQAQVVVIRPGHRRVYRRAYRRPYVRPYRRPYRRPYHRPYHHRPYRRY